MPPIYYLKVNNTSSAVFDVLGNGTEYAFQLPIYLQGKGACHVELIDGTVSIDTITTVLNTFQEVGIKSNIAFEGSSMITASANSGGTAFSYLFNVNLSEHSASVGSVIRPFQNSENPTPMFCGGLPDRIVFKRYASVSAQQENGLVNQNYICFTLKITFLE